ncbi:MAG: hypothetical protein B7X82_13785 [Hydrogenophilales bacterium 17-64-65]|nr:MAG: hypothetical protein B7Y27_09625 [Hydrogenophilales bacterium 16-64-40]OZA32321.1 MAG: hypothetical protein B7X82_13785 [Hydrogenophilales bacterium 17-64-65]
MKQISLAATGFEIVTKRTRKREFLDEMNQWAGSPRRCAPRDDGKLRLPSPAFSFQPRAAGANTRWWRPCPAR